MQGMDILKGYITSTSEGGTKAQVQTLKGRVINDVTLLYPYGHASNIQNDDSSLVLLFSVMGSKTNIFGVPFNIPLQPELSTSEVSTGNFKKGNKITFKSNGDIEVVTDSDILETVANLTTTATGKITLSAPEVELGDAVDLALNQAAVMQVVIPGGSSAGTYPVTIVSAGQTKVKA